MQNINVNMQNVSKEAKTHFLWHNGWRFVVQRQRGRIENLSYLSWFFKFFMFFLSAVRRIHRMERRSTEAERGWLELLWVTRNNPPPDCDNVKGSSPIKKTVGRDILWTGGVGWRSSCQVPLLTERWFGESDLPSSNKGYTGYREGIGWYRGS